MNEATWLDRFARQLGLRWPTISPSEASGVAAARLSRDPSWSEHDPETSADDYVRATEEDHPVEPSAFTLTYNAAGATEAQRARAVEAAAAVLKLAGITAAAAVWGAWSRGSWDDRGSPAGQKPSEAEFAAAFIWDRAGLAADAACQAGDEGAPLDDGELELKWR
jgi:hypothetical protein